jgi:hypothetical protein
MYTIFPAVLRQRKSDVTTSFGHSTRSAVYYEAQVPISIFGHLEILIIWSMCSI